jgi:predicted negative regulator of RcsB-dependent stress response
LAEQLKSEYGGTSYAQFAALHLAALAVNDGKLADAEVQLRWVLSKAASGSDTEQVAQLRLARVMAAAGNGEQALAILGAAEPGPYGASYAIAQGDILLSQGHRDEAREAYREALALAGGAGERVNLPALQQKLESLSPVPPRALEVTKTAQPATAGAEAAVNESGDTLKE